MIKSFAHFICAFLTAFMGVALWLAPHIDWSRVKDDSLLSSRAIVVLVMTCFCFVVNALAAFSIPDKTDDKRNED